MQPNQLQQPAPDPVPSQASGSASEASLRERTVLAAKSVIAEQKQNPYKLSQELYRLKAAYLTEEFNIKPQSVEQ